MKYEEVDDIKRNKQAARSAAGMKGATSAYALCGHVTDDDGEIVSSVFEVFQRTDQKLIRD